MKKRILLLLSFLFLLCGRGAESEIPYEAQNIQYVDFRASGSVSKEKKEEQYLENLQSMISEVLELQSMSMEIQNADTAGIVSVMIKSDDSEQKKADVKAAVEKVLSKIFPDGTEIMISFELE